MEQARDRRAGNRLITREGSVREAVEQRAGSKIFNSKVYVAQRGRYRKN